MSPRSAASGFHRLFRRHTRLTVSDYVAELRIGQACALLVNSSRPIAHIAGDVGYANLANFNRQLPGAEEDDAACIPAEFCGALAMRLITAPDTPAFALAFPCGYGPAGASPA